MIRVVTMRSDVVKRSLVVGAGLLLAGSLSACGGSGTPGQGQPAPQTSQAQTGPKINDPRNAAAVDRCKLLPADTATSLGFDPQGRFRKNTIDPSGPESCSWQTADGSDSVSMSAIDNRSIQEYYTNKSQYSDFQELQIAGHPAVRANQDDPKQTGACDIFLATKENQILAAQADVYDKSKDACALGQKALEASVPTLPAAG